MKYAIIIFSIIISTQFALAQHKKVIVQDSVIKYIGLEYPGNIDLSGYENEAGYLFNNKYSLTIKKKGKVMMVWFELFLSRDSIGRLHFKVLDVLTLPSLKKNQIFLFGKPKCQYGYEDNGSVFAIGINNDPLTIDDIIYAWRANCISQKIESISTDNVQCINRDPAAD